MEFQDFPKMARLTREVIVTEKIDGTNAQVFIAEDGTLLAGSRTRWITPADEGAAAQAAPVTIAGESLQIGEWVCPYRADHDTVVWREDGVTTTVLWAPRSAGFGALDAAAAWMLLDGTVKARVVHRREHRRYATADEYRIWRKAVMVSIEEIPGTDAECIEAGKLVHPAIVRFLRDDMAAALAADAESDARHSAGVSAIFGNGGEE